MRSGTSDDLTTRARIRDAALAAIGRSGFTAVTVRAIAAEVGVSPALVLHHFGSKEGLREACDDWVFGIINAQIDEITADSTAATVLNIMDRTPELARVGMYIRRALQEDGPKARQMFDTLVADTRRYLDVMVETGQVRPTDNETNRAIALVTFSLGAQTFAHHIAPPGTGEQELITAVADQLTLPVLELFTFGLFTNSELLDGYRQRSPETTTGAAAQEVRP